MAKATTKISDTARAMLTLAATTPDRLVRPPQLPVAAARQVVRSLLNNGYVEETPAATEHTAYAWRTGDDGTVLMLRATDAGLAAAGVTPPSAEMPQTIEAFTQQVISFLAEEDCNATIVEEAEVKVMLEDGFANDRPAARVAHDIITWLGEEEERAEEEAANAGATGAGVADQDAVAREAAAVADALDAAPTAPAKANRHDALRRAAAEVLEEWDDRDNQQYGLPEAIERLRAALAEPVSRHTTAGTKRAPREGTNQELVLSMLRREEGASGPQIAEATGWAPHTVRGFLAGLKKKGIKVEAAERVRQDGAKGGYTVYKTA